MVFHIRDNVPSKETSGARRTDFSTVGRTVDVRSSSVTEVSMKSWRAIWGNELVELRREKIWDSQLGARKLEFST